jgi:hypothetical protein
MTQRATSRSFWGILTAGLWTLVLAAAGFVAAEAQTTPTSPGEKAPPAKTAPKKSSPTDEVYKVELAEPEEKPAGDADAAVDSVADGEVPKIVNQKFEIDPFLQLIDPRIYRIRIVIRVDAPDGPAKNVTAMGPIPMDWPEQQVKLISQKMTPGAKCTEKLLKGQAAILTMQVPSIPKGGSAFVERLYEITRYRTEFKMPPEELSRPRKLPADLREQLTGPAPGMEMKHPKIVDLAKSLKKEDARPWDNVHGFWKWTRDNVRFENGDFRGALFAVENGCGDCEEMSALFISLCRLTGNVARTVWVEGHDYPEFYLEDKQGKGHWIPAQVVGPPWFGEIMEYRPIFQKGDRFYDPFQRQYLRYVPHTVKGEGNPQPKVRFDHIIIADSDINGPTYNNPR